MIKGVCSRFSNHERNQSRRLHDKMRWDLKGLDNQLCLMMISGGVNLRWHREAFPLLRPQKDVFFIALLLVLVSLGGRNNERRIMGGDPVTTEPIVLKVDEEDISLQVVKTWNDGKVTVNGLEFIISEQLIMDVLGLPREGKIISREKTNQVGKLTKFIKDDETFYWLQSRIAQDSSHLQKKSADKSKVVDFVESTEEEIEDSDVGKSVEVGKYAKDVGPWILNKGSVKGPNGTHNLAEDLKCHLKVLNGLGGLLTRTYACINVLTLEITNYLKEVVSNLKDLSLVRNQ
eukprot:Gb_25459 [translate_table: standard]